MTQARGNLTFGNKPSTRVATDERFGPGYFERDFTAQSWIFGQKDHPKAAASQFFQDDESADRLEAIAISLNGRR